MDQPKSLRVIGVSGGCAVASTSGRISSCFIVFSIRVKSYALQGRQWLDPESLENLPYGLDKPPRNTRRCRPEEPAKARFRSALANAERGCHISFA